MTWARWVRLIGLVMLGIWLTYTVCALAALGGIEAAERTEPGRGVTTIPAPTWHPAR